MTAAIIRDGETLLICRRPAGGRHPGVWEFPGGKVEEGETPQECLAREMMEELRVEVEVGEMLASVRHDYEDLAIVLLAFETFLRSGELADIGCSGHAWATLSELEDLDLLPPDRKILSNLV